MTNAPMPSYNPEWSAQPAAVLPQRPQQIQWAFLLILAAAALQVLSAIFTAVYMSSDAFRETVVAQVAAQNVEANGQDLVGIAVAVALGTTIVMAVVAVIIYVAIAFLIKSGRGWARIVGAVLAAISITHLFGMSMPAGIFTVLQVAAGIVAVIFCFIAPGSKYFTDMKNFRLANKAH